MCLLGAWPPAAWSFENRGLLRMSQGIINSWLLDQIDLCCLRYMQMKKSDWNNCSFVFSEYEMKWWLHCDDKVNIKDADLTKWIIDYMIFKIWHEILYRNGMIWYDVIWHTVMWDGIMIRYDMCPMKLRMSITSCKFGWYMYDHIMDVIWCYIYEMIYEIVWCDGDMVYVMLPSSL